MKVMKVKDAADFLAANSDAVFVDVRSRQEFVAGHPEGAVNVPVAEPDEYGQMQPNRDFAAVMKALAPDSRATLVFT